MVGVIGTSRDEDHAFIYLTNHFSRLKLPVPKVLAASDDQLRYLQTDLGSMSLFDAIRGGREAGGDARDAGVCIVGGSPSGVLDGHCKRVITGLQGR